MGGGPLSRRTYVHRHTGDGQSGDLAYAIYFEKGEARIGDVDEYRSLVLRVTVIYRREEGTWKIVHRHADPILQKPEATAILQQR